MEIVVCRFQSAEAEKFTLRDDQLNDAIRFGNMNASHNTVNRKLTQSEWYEIWWILIDSYWFAWISATTSRKLKYLSEPLSLSSHKQKQLWHRTNQSVHDLASTLCAHPPLSPKCLPFSYFKYLYRFMSTLCKERRVMFAYRNWLSLTDGQISKSDPMNSQSLKMPLHLLMRWFLSGKPHRVSLWQPYCRVMR